MLILASELFFSLRIKLQSLGRLLSSNGEGNWGPMYPLPFIYLFIIPLFIRLRLLLRNYY